MSEFDQEIKYKEVQSNEGDSLGLLIAEFDGKYWWQVYNPIIHTDNKEYWDEIPRSLYDELLKRSAEPEAI